MSLFDVDSTQSSNLLGPSSMATRDLLSDLGFEPFMAQFTDQQPGYRYNFGNLVLEAVQVTNQYCRPEMLFTGTVKTARMFGSVTFSLHLNVESFEQGVALIAYNIGGDFEPSRPTPWLELGRSFEEHLPGRRELRLFQQRPKCQIEAEWFRVAVKKLISAGEASAPESTFTVSFSEGVLRFDTPSFRLPIPALGSPWATTYSCNTAGLKHLSKRTPSDGVEVAYWQGRLSIGRLVLPTNSLNQG